MAKAQNKHLLFPGETEWEIWTLTGKEEASLFSSHPVDYPSEIEKLPTGDLMYLFPVRALTALPLRVQTGDSSLFPDLAATHAERLGLRPDPLAGQLTDIFPILINSEASTLLSVILRNPSPQDLPLKSPKAFDISPRAFSVKGNTLAAWRELNSWAFALHQDGKLIYCQSTSSTAASPDQVLIREIKISIAQLSMQGIECSPSSAVVWSSDPETDTTLLSTALSVQTDLSPRPAPTLPNPVSKLLPADVRAARKAAQKQQNTILAIAAIAILYLGTVCYLGFDLWKTQNTTAKLSQRVNAIAPEGEAYALHIAKWDELEECISLEKNTVDILSRIAKSIPSNSGLRLKTADISPTEIRLQGEAPQPQAVNQFSLNLNKNNGLVDYEWQTPEPRQSSRGWEFNYTGIIPTVAP
ncbi:MAG: hypothetical protein AB8D78_10205 [Akkermansiaceae bacterium]